MKVSDKFLEDITTDVSAICCSDGLYFDDDSEEIWYDDSTETNAKIATGASKLVLIYDDEDVVCKVPAARIQYEVYSEDNDDECKYSFEDRTDYCAEELEVYRRACAEGLGKAFAAVELGIKVDNNQTYYAEKATGFSNEKYMSKPDIYRASITNSISNNHLSDEISDWIWAVFVDAYGVDFCKRLSVFIDENQINDICSRNCGMVNGRPVFIDYSGYFD